MEQQIRFAKTSDGVSIAYATVGSGPPLVYACGWPGNLALEWEKPFAREFIESFGDQFTLIRYDMRSAGLSEAAEDMSLEALVKDLEAVVDELALETFALMSLGLLAGPIAMTYAAAHPDRVSRLVLLGAFLRGNRLLSEDQYKAMSGFVTAFGQLITPTRENQRFQPDPEIVRQAAGIHEAGGSPEVIVRLLETMFRSDLTEVVERLDMPALALHGSEDERVTLQMAREVAARLRNVQFVPYEGTGGVPWADRHIILPEIFEFLGAERPPELSATPAAPPTPSVTSTVLFTDIVSSTALTQRLGDAKAQALVRAHDTIVRDALAAHGGREIKHTGDGIMASFPTASAAVECAVAIQRGIEADGSLSVRIGLNAGEPVAEDADLFGTAVQLARRICDHGDGGEILVSDVVRQLAAGKGLLFADRGDVLPKGFDEAVRLYEVRWKDDA